MEKERLRVLSFDVLRDIADRTGIKYDEYIDKNSLVEQIVEAFEEDRTERERGNNAAMQIKSRKFSGGSDDELVPSGEAYELPDSYGQTRVVLLLRDPFWAFAYWDVSDADLDTVEEDGLNGRYYLRVHETDSGSESIQSSRSFDIPVKRADRSRYINLPRAGRKYVIELRFHKGADDSRLCISNPVLSPATIIEGADQIHRDSPYTGIMAVAGLNELGELMGGGGIPQRIISLLDTQYLHLQG